MEFWKKFNELIEKNMSTTKSTLTVEKFSILLKNLKEDNTNKDFNSFIIELSKKSLNQAMNGNFFYFLILIYH